MSRVTGRIRALVDGNEWEIEMRPEGLRGRILRSRKKKDYRLSPTEIVDRMTGQYRFEMK